MKRNELPPLPDRRQEIHDLILMKHSTGLSPPEEQILNTLEANELLDTRSGE